jgi:aspartate racemase
MGPRSTGPFLELVYDECQKQYHAKFDSDYPEIVIYSWPTPFYMDRPIDDDLLSGAITRGLIELSKANVSVIAIPCNTAHKYYKKLLECTDAKLLNIIECAINRIDNGSGKITVLGTETTMDMGIYQDALIRHGKEYYFRKDWQHKVDQIIRMIKNKEGISNIIERYTELEKDILKANVDTTILACTDLAVIPELYRKSKVIDSSQELARELIKEYLR